MNKERRLQITRLRRKQRTRARISGTAERPRLSVARSLRAFYAQLINDESGKTLAAVHSREVKDGKHTKTEIALRVGKTLAEKAMKQGITVAVFDKGAYRYHGRVKACVEGARVGGLKI